MLNSYKREKETDSIFMTNYGNTEDISGKITYTNILETIPNNRSDIPLDDWRSKNKTEWRWRFLEFNNKSTVEISYLKYNTNQRQYFAKSGSWITRQVPNVYDDYVVKQFFYYSGN